MNIVFKTPTATYAAWRKEEQEREKSSSGGLATVLSEMWINEGGIVYGAAFIKPFNFQHIRCTNKEQLKRLRGSKYVQSSMDGVLKLIEEDLKSGKKILFIGTPCQVSTVISKFNNKNQQLYTIDIICHGTPKINLLKESIPKKALNIDFDNIEFRNNNNFRISFKKDERIVWSRSLAHDLYMKGFFKAVFYRECCYKCIFAQEARISDITLGDFWGLDMSEINSSMEKGISLVLINTEIGNKLFENIKDNIEWTERKLIEAIKGNNQLQKPMRSTWRHKVFKRFYPLIGFKLASVLSMPDIVLKNLFK